MKLSLFFTVSFLVFEFAYAANPVVQLPEYQVTGWEYSFQHKGNEFVTNAFYSLPYAQSPVGKLRFEKPLALPVNGSKKIVGQVLPPGCVQQEDFAQISPNLAELYPVSEDCLFLNVMAPSKSPPPGKKYPVLVWIYGGAFVYGMSRFYGMETLARHFNPKGIVVVGIQYRLAFLGFLSLDSSYANIGLYDQSAALKWINTHISSFGGDPNKITLWGSSAGSVSTHSHSLSPLSNRYFRYGIQSSGSLYSLWTHANHTRVISANFSTTLGCSSTDINSAKACLRTKSIDEMWKAVLPFKRANNGMDTFHWTPLMDEAFYGGKSIKQLTLESPVKNIMYGTTYAEGLVFTLKTDSIVASLFTSYLGRKVDEQSSYTEADFSAYMAEYLNTKATSGNNRAQIQKLLHDHYYADSAQSSSVPKFWYIQETASQTEGTFLAGIVREIKEKLKAGGKNMYMYLFEYLHPSHVPLVGLPQKYAPHAYENQYLTDSESYFAFNKSDTNAVELAFTQKLVNGMAAFVKTGNPSTCALVWPKIQDYKKIDYMKVGETVAAGNTYFNNISKVWMDVYDLGYGSKILV